MDAKQEVLQAWKKRALAAQRKIRETIEPERARTQYEMMIAQRLLRKARDQASRETWRIQVDVLQMFVIHAENELAQWGGTRFARTILPF